MLEKQGVDQENAIALLGIKRLRIRICWRNTERLISYRARLCSNSERCCILYMDHKQAAEQEHDVALCNLARFYRRIHKNQAESMYGLKGSRTRNAFLNHDLLNDNEE